jgi:mono/diheme cytochrome c family protein
MSTNPKKKTSARSVVIVTVAIVAIFSILFLLEFVRASQNTPSSETAITADSYVPEVSALLKDADASRGEALVNTKYECHTCHIEGAGAVAPDFTGLSENAATRRPPLTAPAYLYESIVKPGVYLVEREDGKTYPDAMPPNYHERLTDQELGDVIAYLLTQ